ncbi:MAG TPA: amidohydrolase family protein [Marmoricola sp.]
MYADELLRPWLGAMLPAVPGLALFDCHNHVGQNDPSGFTATLEELVGCLDLNGGRSVVMPTAEPHGYGRANADCAAAAAASGGRLTAFTRITPGEDPVDMLDQGLAAGARGVKLHGASDDFVLDDPRLREVYRRADHERLPVLVHAGPELDDVGKAALRVCHEHPGLRMILAHCALTDLGWIWREVASTPNLFFDTSWWTPAHLLALFRLVPPGRILLASDLPYATPLSGAIATLRCAWQAGLDEDQVRSVAGGQLCRLVDREDPLDMGAPPTRERRPPGPLLEILSSSLLIAMEPLQRGRQPGDPLTLARHGCDVLADDPDADVIGSVSRLIRLYDGHSADLPHRNQYTPGWDLIAAAAVVARTPAAPLPGSGAGDQTSAGLVE